MKLLLHCCCGPCTTVVADHFLSSGEDVVAWFYNPNLGPAGEWTRRREGFLEVRGRCIWGREEAGEGEVLHRRDACATSSSCWPSRGGGGRGVSDVIECA